MDAREIETKSKALTKAVSAGETPATIISLLKNLQKGVKPTEDLLRSTKVGIIVNKLKQHKSPDVARLSSEIVSRWRSNINKQKSSPSSPSPKATPNGSVTPVSSSAATATATATTTAAAAAAAAAAPAIAPAPSDKMSKSTVPPDKRSWKADGVDVAVNGSKTRDGCVGLIYDGLCLNSTEAPRVILAKAVSVETAAYKFLGPETKEQYRTKIRSLFQNLRNKANPGLRVRVLGDEVTADQFVRMTHEELKSDEQREKDRKIEKENMDKAMVAKAERSISQSLKCGKCGQRKVTYTEAQTRSADEPMTLFCTCLACGKSWRQ